MTTNNNQNTLKDVDLSFIPTHVLNRLEDKSTLERYESILNRGLGRVEKKSYYFKCLCETKKLNEKYSLPATTMLFKDIVQLRHFDKYGNPLQSKREHSSGEIIVRKTMFKGKPSKF